MHVFHQDIAWTTEFCEFMMVWVTFLGGASAARRGAHMTITEFIDKLDRQCGALADVAIQALCLVVLVLLVWYGLGIVMANWGNVLTVLEWPMALQYMRCRWARQRSLVFVAWDLSRSFAASRAKSATETERCCPRSCSSSSSSSRWRACR